MLDVYLSYYYKKYYGIQCKEKTKNEKERLLKLETIQWFLRNTLVSDTCKSKLNAI